MLVMYFSKAYLVKFLNIRLATKLKRAPIISFMN
jgi:hypothetical protein